MVCTMSQEWNFVYVLPNHPGKTVEIGVSLTLEIGWALLSPFLCSTPPKQQGLRQLLYPCEPAGALSGHSLEEMMILEELLIIPNPSELTSRSSSAFLQLIEVFVDDFIQLT